MNYFCLIKYWDKTFLKALLQFYNTVCIVFLGDRKVWKMIAIYIKSFLSGKYFEFFLQYTHLMMCWYNDKIWWWRKERERKKRMGKGFISDATSMLEHMCYFYHLSKNCLCNFWIKQNFCTDIFSNSFD